MWYWYLAAVMFGGVVGLIVGCLINAADPEPWDDESHAATRYKDDVLP